jgi:hypothetical protein
MLTDMSCLGGVFVKNACRETMNFPKTIDERNLVSRLFIFTSELFRRIVRKKDSKLFWRVEAS